MRDLDRDMDRGMNIDNIMFLLFATISYNGGSQTNRYTIYTLLCTAECRPLVPNPSSCPNHQASPKPTDPMLYSPHPRTPAPLSMHHHHNLTSNIHHIPSSIPTFFHQAPRVSSSPANISSASPTCLLSLTSLTVPFSLIECVACVRICGA